jgi:hypothetical protein
MGVLTPPSWTTSTCLTLPLTVLTWRPTVLLVTIRRYRCAGCGHVWRQDTSKAAGQAAGPGRRHTAPIRASSSPTR